MPSFKSRVFCAILYDEDETHRNAINLIKEKYNYALILHDKDEDENGNLKKPHYHVILKFENGRWSSALAESLKIGENYLEPCKKIKSALLYLIHFNDYDKYLYSVDDVKGPLKKELVKILSKEGKDEDTRICEIYKWINSQPKPLSVWSLSKFCYENGYWDVYRRSSSIFFRCIDEYNYCKDNFYPRRYYRQDDIYEFLENHGR